VVVGVVVVGVVVVGVKTIVGMLVGVKTITTIVVASANRPRPRLHRRGTAGQSSLPCER